MLRVVLLDAGVVGLLCSTPRDPAGIARVRACAAWLDGLDRRVEVAIPDITGFEVRRELLRIDARGKLARLDRLRRASVIVDTTREAWAKAAEFWALVRRVGLPTASPEALDADAILAGIAATLATPGDAVTIATTNVRHLNRFPGIDARTWETIA